MTSQFRGLKHFIDEIRDCVSHETELERVNEERQKIRQAFSKNVSEYDLKKYTLKLFYMSILGYKIDFGLVPISRMMSSKNKEEKLIGYLCMQQLLRDSPDFLRLVTQTLMNDLQSELTFDRCLALDFIANTADAPMAEVITSLVMQLASEVSKEKVPTLVRKKAVLALARLFTVNYQVVETSGALKTLAKFLNEGTNVGFLTSLMQLFSMLVEKNPEPFEDMKFRSLYLTKKIIVLQRVSDDHMYYQFPCPWLLISIMKFLRKLSVNLVGIFNTKENKDDDLRPMVAEVIDAAFQRVAKVGTSGLQSKINIHWAVCVEACETYAFYAEQLVGQKFDIQFLFDVINSKATASNIRYAAFRCLSALSDIPYIINAIRHHISDIAESILNEKDYSVQHEGLILLFNAADESSAPAIVSAFVFCAANRDSPLPIRQDKIVRCTELCKQFKMGAWVVKQLLDILPLAEELGMGNTWVILSNILVMQNNPQVITQLLDQLKDAERHLQQAIFCLAFVQGMKLGLQVNDYAATVQRAIISIPTRDETYTIAANALIAAVALGAIGADVLNPYCYSENAEVQQRVCEAFVLIQAGKQRELLQMLCYDMGAYQL